VSRLTARLTVTFVLAVGAAGGRAETGVETGADSPAGTRWADPSRVELGVEFPGEGYHADWELFRCECGDLLVRSELSMPGEVDQGETVLVQGRAVLSRGFGEQQAELGSSLDAPALMMQLALRLLERAAPDGPAPIDAQIDVELEDGINPIHLETYSAIGGFPAPWSVTGRIAPAGEGLRRFDLRFEFTAPTNGGAKQGRIRLKGIADFSSVDFPVSEAGSLAGWSMTWRNANDAAIPAASRAETLDDLRKAIENN
jgi:hypothetical protein